MINIQLLELGIKQIKSFDFDNENDIIKIEKILKAEEKLNPKILINDVEQLISFLHTYKGLFVPFFVDVNISRMIRGAEDNLHFSTFNIKQTEPQIINEFRQIFEENIYGFIAQKIRISDWESLKVIFNFYRFLISDLSLEKTNQSLSAKNQSLVLAIKNNQYLAFVESNPFTVDPNYYALLSLISAFHFDHDIFKINNIISDSQLVSPQYKIVLGKILFALCYYQPHDESLKKTLSQNQQAAYEWLSIKPPKTYAPVTNKTLLITTGFALGVMLLFAIANKSIFGASIPISIAIGMLVYHYIRKKQIR